MFEYKSGKNAWFRCPDCEFSWTFGKMCRVQTYFTQGVFGAWQKQNILGPSTLQALSIFDIYFITRRDFFIKNREEDVNNNIVINCYKFIAIYNNL